MSERWLRYLLLLPAAGALAIFLALHAVAVRRAWLHGVVGPFASWRYVRTAVTRRLTDRSSDRPSFEKIVLMYFSTEDSDRWRASAIVGFDLPSAISTSTSTSRSLSMRRGDSVCRAR